MSKTQKTPIIINNNVVINFNTTTRGKLWKIPNQKSEKNPLEAALPWGRAAKIKWTPHFNVNWQKIQDENIQWTHHLTINIDPKIKSYSNELSPFKKILKEFFAKHKSLYTHLALVIEKGDGKHVYQGSNVPHYKYHAHCLIKTTRGPTLIAEGAKEFSICKSLDKQTAFILRRKNDTPGGIQMEHRFIGQSDESYPTTLYFKNTNGWPYLRKDINNHDKCYFFV